MKRIGIFGFALLAACVVLYAAGRDNPSALQQAAASGEMIRLHVVAASDDPEDQQTKLAVRDAVLERYAPQLEAAPDKAAMSAIVQDSLAQIEQTAKSAAASCGYGGSVSASYGVYSFPDKTYAGELIPAGDYTALRIVLGDGAGANWWCVMYPPLCFVGEEAVPPGKKVEVQYESSIAKWFRSWTDKASSSK